MTPAQIAVSEEGLLGAGSKKLGGMFVVSFLLCEQPETKTIRFTVQSRSKSFIDGYFRSGFFEDQVI